MQICILDKDTVPVLKNMKNNWWAPPGLQQSAPLWYRVSDLTNELELYFFYSLISRSYYSLIREFQKRMWKIFPVVILWLFCSHTIKVAVSKYAWVNVFHTWVYLWTNSKFLINKWFAFS